jgi:hypothetical protein
MLVFGSSGVYRYFHPGGWHQPRPLEARAHALIVVAEDGFGLVRVDADGLGGDHRPSSRAELVWEVI